MTTNTQPADARLSLPGLRLLGAALAAAGLLAACSPGDRKEVRNEAKQAAESAGNAAGSAASSVAAGAEKAMDKTERALDDTGITAKVKTALLADELVRGLAINVDTSHATVTLSGDARTAAEKARAEELASRVEGVHGVKNDIVVAPAK